MLDQRLPQVPGYRLERLVGEGGQGCVYRALREPDGLPVAVKLLSPGIALGDFHYFTRRFQREIDVSKAFAHPNLVKVLDGGSLPDRSLFLVTEFLDGHTLAGAPLPVAPDLALAVARQVSAAFAYYHPRGLVHRDIKPSNVFVATGRRVVLIDFGLAHADDRTRLTATGSVTGTLLCMAPEQLRGEKVTARTDVYQLGVTLFWALTGDCPFTGDVLAAVVAGGAAPRAVPLRQVRPEVPAALERVVERCLDPDPAGRFATGEQLAEALDWVPAARPARRAAAAPPAPRPRSRTYAALAVLALAVALVAARRPSPVEPAAAVPPSRAGEPDPGRRRAQALATAQRCLDDYQRRELNLPPGPHADDPALLAGLAALRPLVAPSAATPPDDAMASAYLRLLQGQATAAARAEGRELVDRLGERAELALYDYCRLLCGLGDRPRLPVTCREEAAARCRAALQRDPPAQQRARLTIELASQLECTDRRREALALLDAVDPATVPSEQRHRFHANRGDLLQALGRPDEAIASMRRALGCATTERQRRATERNMTEARMFVGLLGSAPPALPTSAR